MEEHPFSEQDIYDWLDQPEPSMFEVATLADTERARAKEKLGFSDIEPLPEWFTDDTLDALKEDGYAVRYTPIGEDKDPAEARPGLSLFSQDLAEPGWYLCPTEPVSGPDLGELIAPGRPGFKDHLSPEEEFAFIQPEQVQHYYLALALLESQMPKTSSLPVRLPTVMELWYLLRTDNDAKSGTYLCRNFEQPHGAAALIRSGPDDYEVEPFALEERFDGAIMPLRKIA